MFWGEPEDYRPVNMTSVLGKLSENTLKKTCKRHKWA